MAHIHCMTRDTTHTGWPAAGASVTVAQEIQPPSFAPIPELSPELAWTGSGFWVEAQSDSGSGPADNGTQLPAQVLVDCPQMFGPDGGTWPGNWMLTVAVSADEVTALGIDASAFTGFTVHALALIFVDLSGD
jgi:hypothetical protein